MHVSYYGKVLIKLGQHELYPSNRASGVKGSNTYYSVTVKRKHYRENSIIELHNIAN